MLHSNCRLWRLYLRWCCWWCCYCCCCKYHTTRNLH